jgi:hypothetical protein
VGVLRATALPSTAHDAQNQYPATRVVAWSFSDRVRRVRLGWQHLIARRPDERRRRRRRRARRSRRSARPRRGGQRNDGRTAGPCDGRRHRERRHQQRRRSGQRRRGRDSRSGRRTLGNRRGCRVPTRVLRGEPLCDCVWTDTRVRRLLRVPHRHREHIDVLDDGFRCSVGARAVGREVRVYGWRSTNSTQDS